MEKKVFLFGNKLFWEVDKFVDDNHDILINVAHASI